MKFKSIANVAKAVNDKLMGFYLAAAFILAWQFAPALGWTNATFVPPFSDVLLDGAQVGIIKILVHICISMRRVIIGFAISAALALPLGFILGGAAPKAALAIRPLIAFLQQIPPYILYPLFLLLFGPGENGILLVIFWSVFWPLFTTTMQGISSVDPSLVRCARSMGANGIEVFFKTIIPAVFPNIMMGIRTGLTMGFLMLIGAESMGADSGVGWMMHNAQGLGWIPRIYLGALIVCVVGFLLNAGLQAAESVFTDWKPSRDAR
jgi:NitT/TauT family transport system permease protein